MQAIILAAGVGTRLSTLSGGGPKCLVEIGGRPLILHQLEMLADHGIGPVIVVTGYQADAVKTVIGDRAQTLVNDLYAETNSLYSLWLARDLIAGPFVLLNSDLFFDPAILDKLLHQKGNALAYDSTSSRGREQTKVVVRAGDVVDLGKDVPSGAARGESLGLVKFDEAGSAAIFNAANLLIASGNQDAWVLEGTRSILREVRMAAVNVAGLPWAEIDFPYDLDVARREVWPAIHRRRFLTQARWRRARQAVVAAAILAIGFTGWYANSKVGPGSTNWETVMVEGGHPVQVRRETQVQSWVLAPGGSVVTGVVRSDQVSVETRLILPAALRGEYRYVVAVTVDGEPVTWKVHATRRDTLTKTPAGLVGERERVKIDLPPGSHTVGVRLIDGHGAGMLVRLRERNFVDKDDG